MNKTAKVLSILLLFFVAVSIAFGYLFLKEHDKTAPKDSQVVKENLYDIESYKAAPVRSRSWMLYAMDIVRDKKPTPPESARFYAYVANAYNLALNEGKTGDFYAKNIIDKIYPDLKDNTEKIYNSFGGHEEVLSSFFKSLIARTDNDHFSDVPSFSMPQGPEYWKGENPFSPGAGKWSLWISSNIWDKVVSSPTKYGSPEFKKELEVVRLATQNRSAEDSADINFWGGVPGTEAPSGIWQNRFFFETSDYNLTDHEYSRVQDILASTLADTFIQVWDIKYKYWTLRPSMADPSIKTAMKNPNFPGFVSGHSAVSRAAAEILGTFFPAKKQKFLTDAEHARDSRLKAGIHFPSDNAEGFKLGEAIGKDVVRSEGITALRDTGDEDTSIDNHKPFSVGDGQFSVTKKNEYKGNKDKEGALWMLSKPGLAGIVFATNPETGFTPQNGWSAKKMSNDSLWTPGTCSSMPFEIVDKQYIAMVEQIYNPDGTTIDPTFFVYDIKTNTYYILNDVVQKGAYLDKRVYINPENGKLTIFYFPGYKANQITGGIDYGTSAIMREIDIPEFTYKDYSIALPKEVRYYASFTYINQKLGLMSGGGEGSNETITSYLISNHQLQKSTTPIAQDSYSYLKDKYNFLIDTNYGSNDPALVNPTTTSYSYYIKNVSTGAHVYTFPNGQIEGGIPFHESEKSVYFSVYPHYTFDPTTGGSQAAFTSIIRYIKADNSIETLFDKDLSNSMFLIGAIY